MTTDTFEELSDARRRFLNAAVGLFSTATIIGILYPTAMFLWPREKKKGLAGARSMKIPLGDVAIGEAKFVRFLNKPTVIIRPNEQELVALSAVCTHLGCIVKWRESRHELWCPCHGGVFDTKGAVLAGPPPAPLKKFVSRIEDEYIVIEEA